MSFDSGRTLLNEAEEKKWNARRRELEAQSGYELAQVFRGWIPFGYEGSNPKILYVGKATAGEFAGRDEERASFNKGGSAFWRFARQIAHEVGCEADGIPCIAWSNISKLAPKQIKAESLMIAGFEDEAALTLESETQAAKPDAIVFVTAHFSDRVVNKFAGVLNDSQWNKSENETSVPEEQDIWWRRRADGRAVLWMRHPERARARTLEYAATKVGSLTVRNEG